MTTEKKVLSESLRVFIERQIEILERLADELIEFQDEYLELKRAYTENAVEALTVYANEYGVFDTPKVKNKKERSFFLVEPIRRQGKISLDNYWVRCLVYYRKPEENFFISEKVFWLAELKKFTKSNCFDLWDYQEALELFESLEGIQEKGRY